MLLDARVPPLRQGGWIGPVTTPLESPQSNGMAEAFVRTLKRDYVRVSPVPDAATVLSQLPGWLAHYNEVHPHRALGYRSPREFIRLSTPEACPGIKGQQQRPRPQGHLPAGQAVTLISRPSACGVTGPTRA